MSRIVRAVLLVMLLTIAACAADGPFTLEQVMSAPFPGELVAAPHGSRFAWIFDAEGRRNIWVAEGPRFVARQLTAYSSDDGQEITDLVFSGDGNTIAYVRGGDKNTAGEVPNPTSTPAGAEQAVWAIAWAGGAPRKIDGGNSPAVASRGNRVAYVKDNQIWLASLAGPGKPQQVVARGKNASPTWSPNGSLLAFVSNREVFSLIAIYDPAKKTVGYVAPSADRDGNPRWSPDGRSIAFIRLPARTLDEASSGFFSGPDRPNPWAIWVAELAKGGVNTYGEGRAREVWHSAHTLEGSFPSMAGAAVLRWAADGRLVFASEQDGWQRFYSIPAEGGAPALLTPGDCEVEQAELTPDRRALVYSSNCGDIDRRHLWRVAVAGGAPEQLTSGDGIEMSPTPSGDGRWIAYIASDAIHPNMPYVRSAVGNGKPQELAPHMLPKTFPLDQLVVPQQVTFQAEDKTRIHGQLFLPKAARAGARRPAIIFMHGGPVRQMLLGWHYMYYYRNSYAMNQYLASRGYIVLSVNYRSGIGYGRAFRMAPGRGPRGATEYQDIVAGAKYLASRPDVDPKRVGLWGGSYGGYLTAMGLARDSDLFAAGVDLHGVHDWSRFIGQGRPNPDFAKMAREASPVAAINKWRSPVLLIQGDDDRNVNFNQMVDLVPRLREQKVEFEQLVFPDDVHDFLLHRHWLEAYRAGAAFFDAHLKPGS